MFSRLVWNRHTRSWILRLLRFLPLCRGWVMCVCWGGASYNCNPKAITDFVIARPEEFGKLFEVNYAFHMPDRFAEVPSVIHKVEIGSLSYFFRLATAQFIISNIRFAGMMFPYKKRGQIYIQTMHGGHGIKQVEFDVKLSDDYLAVAAEDTRRSDLMLSDSSYWTHVYRTAFRYTGEVLECGLPRNDCFFAVDHTAVRERVLAWTGLPHDAKLLIYTPTFRHHGRREVYGFDTDRLIQALARRFGGHWYILVSSHPNMRSYYREIYDFSHPHLCDVGTYPDLQDLLRVSDVLITDYSSAEMDFSLTRRPVFQLIRDREDYDRGTYLDPRTLPFPYAENDEELVHNIDVFDDAQYQADLDHFNRNVIGLKETGHAAEHVVKWMVKHR